MRVSQGIWIWGSIQHWLTATPSSRVTTRVGSVFLTAALLVSGPAIGAPEKIATGVLNTCFSESADFESRQAAFLQQGWQGWQGWQETPNVRLMEVSKRIADSVFIFRAPSERDADALKRMLEITRTTTNNALRQQNGSFSKSVTFVHSENETAALWLSWVDNASTSSLTCTFTSDNAQAGEDLINALSGSAAGSDREFRDFHFTAKSPEAQPSAEVAGTVALLDKSSFERRVSETLSSTYSVTVSVSEKDR